MNAIKIFLDGNLATVIKLDLFSTPTDFLKTVDTCLTVYGKGAVSFELFSLEF